MYQNQLRPNENGQSNKKKAANIVFVKKKTRLKSTSKNECSKPHPD